MFQPITARRLRLPAMAMVAGTLLLSGCAGVQGGDAAEDSGKFPSRAVELTVPYDPGGSSDLIGRALAKSMEKPLGESVVVVNKPGGGGVVGAREVLGGAANGYAEVVLSKSQFTISPLVESAANVLDLDEMRVLAGLTVEEYALVVQADSPYKTLDDLLAEDSLTFSHSGVGTGTHYSLEVLFKEAGVKAKGVPFDGSAPSITALLGGQVDVSGGNIAEVMPQIKAGKLRPLATFSAKRSEFMPDVPTAEEAGYDIVLDQRRIVAAPADLPDDVADEIVSAIEESQDSDDYRAFLAANYIAFWGADGDKTRRHLKEEAAAVREKSDALGLDFGKDS